MTIQESRNVLEGIGHCLDELEQEYLKAGIDHFNLYGWVPPISIVQNADVQDARRFGEQLELVRRGVVPTDYPQNWPRSTREKLPPGTMRYNAAIETAIQKRKQEIKLRLESTSYPLYPRDSVRMALEFWAIEL